MLELKNIYKTFNPGTINEKRALNGLNLKLNEGDFVTVIGGNGAGKSTMLNAVAGTWPVDEGQILIDNIDVTKLSEHKRATYLGRVFQDPMTGTAATMGIEENLALAKRRGKSRLLRSGITKAEREEYKELLKILGLGLEDRLTSKVGLLSGGQRQALTLLMATLQKPKLLLLDEHTAALDPKTAAKVLEITDMIVNRDHLTTLMITHNMKEAILNTYFMSPPRIYRWEQMIFNPEYEGESFMNLGDKCELKKDAMGNCLSTTKKTNGAVAVFLPGVAEQLAYMLDSDFYMVFTSVHEVMIHNDKFVEPEDLQCVLRDTIREATPKEDYLTSRIYQYNRETHKFICVTPLEKDEK